MTNIIVWSSQVSVSRTPLNVEVLTALSRRCGVVSHSLSSTIQSSETVTTVIHNAFAVRTNYEVVLVVRTL